MNKIAIIYVILRLMLNHLLLVQSYREHKVHNIVLYPDKHSWCKTTLIKQVISYPGCTSVEINNKVCVGACFSYSIPQTEPSDPGEVITPYCDSCQPSETAWHQITLQCNADTPHQLIKNVQIIHNCSCTPCEKDSLRAMKFSDDNDDLLLQTNVDKEILNALHVRNESISNDHVDGGEQWKKMHRLLNVEILNTLDNIQLNNADEDKEKLFEIFDVIQDPRHKNKVKARDIIHFIETLPQNVTNLDTRLLAEILLKFEKNRKTKIYDATNDKSSVGNDKTMTANDREDSSAIKKEETHDSAIPVWMHNAFNFKFEQINESVLRDEGAPENEHRQHTNFDTVPPVAVKITEDRPMAESITAPNEFVELHNTRHTHQHHHINDNIATHSHLTRGPHGALVIEQDRIHEKLVDINAHELKPNHAGTLLSYHSHSSESDSQK